MKVLIIRPGALGDTLMVLPALADLAGKAVITFVARRPGLDFVSPLVHRGLDIERADLAAMHGTPTIALFKESDADQWFPLGPCVRVIQDDDPAFFTLLPPSLPQERDARRLGPARRDPTMVSKDMRLVV